MHLEPKGPLNSLRGIEAIARGIHENFLCILIQVVGLRDG